MIEQITQELTWKLRQQELYPDLPISEIKLPEDDEGMHLGLFHENQLITVVSLFANDKDIQFRKFATDKAFQNQGFGKQMLQYVFDYASENNFERIWCNARTSALGFYEKFDMVQQGDTFTKGSIDYVIMEHYFS